MKEIWKDIQGYEGIYQVSNLGRVRSVDRVVIHKDGVKHLYRGRVLKPHYNTSKYLAIGLHYNGISNTYLVHRLVAQVFIPNPNNLPEVNHIDEVITNNKVDNLEWCTSEYNNNYGNHNKNTAKSIRKAKLWTTEHYIEECKKRNIDLPIEDYKGSMVKIKHKCSKGHIYEQRPYSHLQGKRCFLCYGNKKRTPEEYYNLCKEKGLDLPVEEYVNSSTEINHKCKKCGSLYKQRPSKHLQGQGCPRCNKH